MRAAVRSALSLIAVLLAISSCSGAKLDPAAMDREEVAARFAEAFTSRDVATMRDLVCPEAPEPLSQDASVYAKAEVVGEPTAQEPPGALVKVFGPAPDFFVPYQARVEGTTVRGYVVISLRNGNCVSSWGDTRVSN
jgi:hypothetical protein